MPDTVTLVDDQGQAHEVPVDQAANLLGRGMRIETADMQSQRLLRDAREAAYGGITGTLAGVSTGALRGATLGLSDLGFAAIGAGNEAEGIREINPLASTVGEIGGGIATSFAGPGSALARFTPAGRLGTFATETAELIPGAGIASRVGRLAATGAIEGGIGNAGQYLGTMALQNKPLSAEGFLASMYDGALYGGGAAGALGIAGEGLVAARRLLPADELTPLAARRAKDAAAQEVSRAVDDSRELAKAGRAQARTIREQAVLANPQLQAELDQIALQKAKDLAEAETGAARAKQARLESDAAAAQSRAEGAAARAERAKNPPKRGKKAAPEETAADGYAPPPGVDGSPIKVGAPKPPVADDLNTELMRQLQGTKSAIDDGKSIAELSARRKETLVEDALNQRIARDNPEMARLLKHLDGLETAQQQVATWLDKYPKSKVRAVEYQEGMRKPTGWVDKVPEGEGSIALPRGRQGEFRGDEAQRQSFERGVERRDLRRRIEDPLASAEEKAAAQQRLATMDAESEARKTAKQIVDSSDEQLAHAPRSVDEHVDQALNGHADLADDVDDASEAIGALEQTTADLTDELGDNAPPAVTERSRQYRETQAKSTAATEQATADAAADAEQAAKTIGLGDTPQAKRGARLLEHAQQAGQMLEALKLLGVPVPDPSRLPVVGPLLSLYLKAKLAHRAVSRLGGKIPRTAETEIARRAADTKTKLIRAADRALEGAARAVTSKAAARAAGATTTAVLGAKLFDDRDPSTPEPKARKTDDIEQIYLARRDELERAMAPGAIRESIRRRIKTADAELLDAIASAEETKLKFLYDKMPKTDNGIQVLGKQQRMPSKSDLQQWAKYVSAANRPVETMEAILDGTLTSAEAAETLRTVSPLHLQAVQSRIIEKSAESDVEIPYKRKVHLSMMLGIPFDESQSPESAQFMGMLYQPKQSAPSQGAPSSGPAPNIAANVDPETRT